MKDKPVPITEAFRKAARKHFSLNVSYVQPNNGLPGSFDVRGMLGIRWYKLSVEITEDAAIVGLQSAIGIAVHQALTNLSTQVQSKRRKRSV